MTINRTSFLQAPKGMFFLRSYCGANVFGQINKCARLSKTAVTFKLFTQNWNSLRRKNWGKFRRKNVLYEWVLALRTSLLTKIAVVLYY
jgi:hypothetical protein